MWAVIINNKYTFPGLIIPASYIANYTYTCKAIIQDAVLDFSIVDIKKIIAERNVLTRQINELSKYKNYFE